MVVESYARQASLFLLVAPKCAGSAVFDDDFEATIQTIRPVRAPRHWLLAAGALVVVGVAMSRVSLWGAVLGYLMSSFGAVCLVAKFRWDDRAARRSLYYSPNERLRGLQRVLGVAIVVGSALCALPIADHLARR